MAIRDLTLYLDLAARGLVQGPANSSAVALRFMQGDTYRLVLQGLVYNGSLAGSQIYQAASIGYTAISAGVTLVDSAPQGGTWKVKVGVDGSAPQTTAALPFNIAKADLETALNALSNVGANGIKVITTGASNIYRYQWTTPANALPIAVVDNALTPLCLVRCRTDESVPGKGTIKLMRAPMAFVDDFTRPTPPPAVITQQRAGSNLQNEVQRLTVPPDAVGSLALSWLGTASAILPIATLTAGVLQDAVNAEFILVNTADVRFNVTSSASGVFDIEFVGAYAKQAHTQQFVCTMYDQVPIDTPTGNLPLTALAIEDFLDGSPQQDAIFEIVVVDSTGQEATLVHQICTVVNDALDTQTGSDIAAVATRVDTVYVYPSEEDPAVIALQGQKFTLPTADDDFTFTHDFATEEIDVVVIKQIAGGHFAQFDENLYDWSTLNANQVQVVFQSAVPSSGVGSVQVWVRTLNATPIVNEHRHTTDQIDGVGANDGHTLTEILAELVSNLPDGWPNLPANKIAGTLTPNQIDVAALSTALQQTPQFLDALRSIITDGTLLNNLAAALQTNAAFIKTLAALMSNADVLKALVAALGTSPDFLTQLSSLLIAALQAGSSLPAGTVLMTIPDIDEVFPKPEPRAADDVRGPRFAPVPVPLLTNVGPLTIVGDQLGDPASNAARVSRLLAPAASPTANGRRQIRFPTGTDVCCDGRLYFAGEDQGAGDYFPAELNRTLGILDINELMFAAGTRLAVGFTFFLSTLGGLVGRYAFALDLGTVQRDADDASGAAISGINWSLTPIAAELNLSSVVTSHTFGYTLERASAGALGPAQTVIYATTATTTVKPASARFFLRARLFNADFTNVSAPRGAIVLSMKSQKASIVKL